MVRIIQFLLLSSCLTASAATNSLLLVVEQSLIPALATPLDRYREDLGGLGWSVTTLEAPSATTNYTAQTEWIRSEVWPKLVAHDQVFLVGHVPMPRSGLWLNPDGHASMGAYSAPAFYVTLPTGWQKWTDGQANGFKGWLANAAGDSKWDNQTLPAEPQAGLGLIDFPNATNNAALITGYFDRLHAYRSGQWNVTNAALYAYPATTTRWRDTPGTVAALNNAFGSATRFNAEKQIKLNWTNGQPAVEVIAYKTGDYAPMLRKGVVPKSVAWLAWNSGQFELRSAPNSKDVYASLATTNGPLIIAVNHPDWPLKLESQSTWGDVWRNTFSQPGAPTWSWIMGDPTLRLPSKPVPQIQ
jgi:hypothetical protein